MVSVGPGADVAEPDVTDVDTQENADVEAADEAIALGVVVVVVVCTDVVSTDIAGAAVVEVLLSAEPGLPDGDPAAAAAVAEGLEAALLAGAPLFRGLPSHGCLNRLPRPLG